MNYYYIGGVIFTMIVFYAGRVYERSSIQRQMHRAYGRAAGWPI